MQLQSRLQVSTLVLVLFCLVGVSQPAQAESIRLRITKFRAKCAEAIEPYFHKVVADFSNQDVMVPIYRDSKEAEPTLIETEPLPEAEQTIIKTDKRLGRGFFGVVQIIKWTNNDRLGGGYKGTLTIKIGHAVKWLKKVAWFFTRNANKKELANYEFLHANVDQIKSDPKYPQEAAWANRGLPVTPILSAVHTEYGLSLIKPLVQGKFLKDIKKIVDANGGQLPKDMYDGLRDMYDLVQALHSQVAIRKKPNILKALYLKLRGKTEANETPYSADIRPPNLVWIESPEMLELFGMTKPGFALFELDQVLGGKGKDYIEGHTTFEAYLEQFLSYVNKAD